MPTLLVAAGAPDVVERLERKNGSSLNAAGIHDGTLEEVVKDGMATARPLVTKSWRGGQS